MTETQLLTAAQTLMARLNVWEGPNEDWRRLEASKNESVREPVGVLQWLAEQVVDADIHDAAIDNARVVSSCFQKTTLDMDRIDAFDLAGNDRETEFHRLAGSIRDHARQSLREIGTWACHHALKRTDKPTVKIAELLGEAQELLRQIRECKKEAEKATDAARSAAAESGVGVFADSFKESATVAKKDAAKWLRIAAVIAGLTVALAAYIAFLGAVGDAEGWLWLQRLPGKLFLLSTLTYATVWCGRRSLAERHNSRVNLHRANSIQTVRAFRESGNASATKDAIVLEAARAIFENVQTGDLGGNSDGSPIAKTIELVRPLGDTTRE